ncbi:FG-GAP repeat domain-containing protein [Streptomyces sp. NPDC015661]|uniref:FG-GAP repeat domain-containing protein n=1 Tax=Streptomyces sp. NPDC015661 TaxID=3364961 RepID=UPI0037002D1F
MKHVRMSGRRRLTAAAVTAVLATTGATIATVPAAAAPASGPAAVADETPQPTAARFPLDAEIVTGGTTGFLSRTNGTTPEYRWTRYADGTSTVLPGVALATGGVSDTVVTGEVEEPTDNRVLKLHDMSDPSAAPVEVNLDALGSGYSFAGAVGSTLVVMVDQEDGPWLPHLVTVGADGKLIDRPVTGMPGSVCFFFDGSHAPGTAVVDCGLGYDDGPETRFVVDLATAAVVSSYDAGAPWAMDGAAVSATHVAWELYDGAKYRIGVGRIGTPGTRLIDANGYFEDTIQLLGGWLTYGQPRRVEEGGQPYAGQDPEAPRPFTAQSLDTGEKIALLTHFSSAVQAPDGTLLVRGGSLDKGEGFYRVALGADGKPVATLVAPTGQATAVTLRGTTAPPALTGEQLAKGVDLTWDLSRGDVYAWVTLKHVRTGVQEQWAVVTGDGSTAPQTVGLHWDGKELTNSSYDPTGPALNGEYTWELTARPDEGIGPELVATGRFTVTRPAAPHDFDDNGTADLLVRDPAGVLWRLGSRPTAPGGSLTDTGASRVGSGWGIYDRLETVGNIAGTTAPDAVARDKDGVLWLYQGTGDRAKPLGVRTKIGAGWQIYDQLAGGSDLTGDGRADLVATDKAGDLYLYKGTGSATAPFATRKKIGYGWGIYNQLSATGNIAGGPAGDLVARDRAGVLWLYLGKGDGTFAARTKVGAGWGAFTGLTAVGDANGDGRADLIASNGDETFYAGTGDWRAPFKRGVSVSLTQDITYNTAF